MEGWRRDWRFVAVLGFAVPARLRLSACALSASSLQASLIEEASVAHFFKRLCFSAHGQNAPIPRQPPCVSMSLVEKNECDCEYRSLQSLNSSVHAELRREPSASICGRIIEG